MPKKKTKKFTINAKNVKFTGKEWAMNKGSDPILYEKWKDTLMTEKEFEEIRKTIEG